MSESAAIVRPRRRRVWRLVLAGLGAAALVLGAAWAWVTSSTTARLRRAIAATEALEPNGWLLTDLLNQRRPAPDPEQRSDSTIRDVFAEFGQARWDTFERTGNADPPTQALGAVTAPAPNVRLSGTELDHLKQVVAAIEAPLRRARKLANQPYGRFELTAADFLNFGTMRHVSQVREVGRLLQLDAAVRSQQGDIDGALADVAAIVNTGRSMSDEPTSIAQLVRVAVVSVGLSTLERALGQGAGSDDALHALQPLLEQEANEPIALTIIRGERAISFENLENLRTGRGLPAGATTPAVAFLGQFTGFIPFSEALILEWLNEAQTIAKLPTAEQPARWRAWNSAIDTAKNSGWSARFGMLAYLLMPAIHSANHACLRHKAMLHVALVLIGAERYRLANDRWPEATGDLVPRFLTEAPIDPFSGAPILLKRVGDGLVVYSVGPNGRDDGGALDRRFRPDTNQDWGLRLWDLDQRHSLSELPENVFATEGP